MVSAIFLVNGQSVPGSSQYVSEGSTVTLTLASTAGVKQVTWSFHGHYPTDQAEPTITKSGVPLGSTATFTVPTIGDGYGQAWGITCVVNGGKDAAGATDANLTYRSAIYVYNSQTRVPIFPGETLEADLVAGWGERLNDMLATVGSPTLPTGPANTVLWSNGTVNAWTTDPKVTGSVSIGSTVSSTGQLRLAHGADIKARDNGNANDRSVVSYGVVATDVVGLGNTGTVTRVTGSSIDAFVGANQKLSLAAATGDYLTIGDNPSTTGTLRLKNNFTIKARNNANSTDRTILNLFTDDGVYLHDHGGEISLRPAATVKIFGTAQTAAGTGIIGLPNNTSVKFRNAANTADLTALTVDGSNNLSVGSAAHPATLYLDIGAGQSVYIRANSVSTASFSATGHALWIGGLATYGWDNTGLYSIHENFTAHLRSTARSVDAATSDFTITPQAPFATATGTNRDPGDLIVALAAPTNGGTTEAALKVSRGGTGLAWLGPFSSTTAALWLGPITPGASNFAVYSDGTQLLLNAPNVSSSITFLSGNGSILTLSNAGTGSFGTAKVPHLTQTTPTTDIATNTFTITAQSAYASATGTNRNGAHLDLKAGTKATGGTDGQVRVYSGSGFQNAVFANGQCSFYGTTEIDFFMGGSFKSLIDGSAWRLKNGCQLRWDSENTAPEIKHSAQTTDTLPGDFTIAAQDGYSGATGANRDGGDLLLKSGVSAVGGVTSRVRLFGSNTVAGNAVEHFNFSYVAATSMATLTSISGHIMIQPPASSSMFIRAGGTAGDVNIDTMQATGKFLVRTGAGGDPIMMAVNKNLSLFDSTGSFGGGVAVMYIKDRTTAPTTNPSGGGILYSEGGELFWRSSSGVVTQLTP